MPASRLLGKAAEMMTLRGLGYGAICGACYGLLVAPIATFFSLLISGQGMVDDLAFALWFAVFVALFGTILGAIYGTVLGAISGVLTGLVLGAVTRARFTTLRDPRRYRLAMRFVAVGCAAGMLGPVFAFMPLIPFQDPQSLGGWLVETGGTTLAACVAAWLAGGQFAGWYIRERNWADYIRSVAAMYPYPSPYPAPFAYYPVPYPPLYPVLPYSAPPYPTPPDAPLASPPPAS